MDKDVENFGFISLLHFREFRQLVKAVLLQFLDEFDNALLVFFDKTFSCGPKRVVAGWEGSITGEDDMVIFNQDSLVQEMVDLLTSL